MSTAKLLGRSTASTGAVEEITVGSGLSLSGGTLSASGGSGESVTKSISQTSHGFSVGDVLKYASSTYSKAQADSGANAEVVGIVSAVADANTFTLLTSGYISTLSGLTANTTYFLSASTAGALTATEPSTAGQISKPLLVAVSTTAGYFTNMRGVAITSGSSGDVYALTSKPTTYANAQLNWYANGATSFTSGTPLGYQTYSGVNTTNSFFYGPSVYFYSNAGSAYLGQKINALRGAQFADNKKIVVSWSVTTSDTGTMAWGITSSSSFASFTSSTAVADRIVFRYTSGNTMNVITDSINTGARTTTSVTCPTMSNVNKFRIEFDSTSLVRFYINDSLVATHTTNVPSAGSHTWFGTMMDTSTNSQYLGEVFTSVEV